ncbi:hypothetical protein Ptr902_02766 [Pyrenophora tritici-repentis]|nr:hypothetical protein L13192_08763 [Pyrenophora tritici-repentis]KAI2483826.1 hypothetical protein Ptr902_02766 [Pyrenophora tritici-repentis]
MATSVNQGLSESLSNPEDALVDVVFVHGLNGHRVNTWTGQYDVFWPKDLLSKDLPSARIFTWGYDSKIMHFWGGASQSRINDHSAKLFADLSNMREASKTALVISMNSEDHIRSTGNAVRGLMFLGTPHAGSAKAKWAELGQQFMSLFKDTNKDLLKNLSDNSIKLSDLGQQFPKYLRMREEKGTGGVAAGKIEVVCFYEEYTTKFVGQIVSPESASLAGYDCLSISADHSNMCKFYNAKDPGYVGVLGPLKRWVTLITRAENEDGRPGALTQHAYISGSNNGGFQVGNMNSFGGGSIFGNQTPIFGGPQNFGTQNYGARREQDGAR